MKTIEIVASYSGKVGLPHQSGISYSDESPFESVKEILEVDDDFTDEDLRNRQIELTMLCYDIFQAFKEEALRPLIINHPAPDPKSEVPQLEAIRQKGIKLIGEQGKWFQENDFQGQFRGVYKDVFKKDFDGDLQKISLTGVRHFNRQLGLKQHQLNGVKKIEEEA